VHHPFEPDLMAIQHLGNEDAPVPQRDATAASSVTCSITP
jgi:hypothetical protein